MKCPMCERGNLVPQKVKYSVHGIKLGTFPAQVCNACHEEWFNEKTSIKIQELEKKKGLFGLSKKSKISYSGNSLIVRIPEHIAKFMNLKKEEEITIYPEGKNKLVVEI